MQMAKKQVKFIEACYRLYEQKMYYVAYSILHDEGKAEDAVQDAFLKLMKHEVQFDRADSDDCKRYIITVIRNAAITIYNKTKKEIASQLRCDFFLYEKIISKGLIYIIETLYILYIL